MARGAGARSGPPGPPAIRSRTEAGCGGAMLELQGLTRRFGAAVAVDRVSLTVPSGQMLGIIGRSGAGKSTLLRLVNRLIEPSAGRILADGRDITALRGRALRAWR